MKIRRRFAPRGAWREYVRTRARTLQAAARDAALARAVTVEEDGTVRARGAKAEEWVPIVEAILEHLRTAEEYAGSGDTSRLLDWFTGQRVEGAWYSVHHAEALLLTLLPPTQAAARIPDVLSVAQGYLPADDPRRLALERCYGGRPCEAIDLTPADQLFLADTLRAGYFYNAVQYGRVRSFRNVLAIATVLMLVLAAGLLTIGARQPSTIPLCSGTPTVCPTGTDHATGGDILLVGLVGLIGAGLAAARSLTTGEEIPTRYSPAIAQALLKLPTGVTTAIFGVVALGAGLVPGVNDVAKQGEILIWALLFGFAQQVLTGLLDQRGQKLLAQASPGKS